jgi:hypothetical protein
METKNRPIEMAEEQPLDAKIVWKDVERSASRAPKWAALDPPYSVKPMEKDDR